MLNLVILPSISIAALTLPFDLTLWSLFIWFGRFLGVLFLPPVLLQRSTRPMATLVWILSILFIPYLGVLMWWIFGRNQMKRRRRRHHRARQTVASRVEALSQHPPLPTSHQSLAHLPVDDRFHLVTRNDFNFFPPTGASNNVSVYPTGARAFEAFEAAIASAEHHIHLLFYIWKSDQIGTHFRDLLVERARQGLEVRLLYDAVGAVGLRSSFFAPLIDAGGEVASFLPLSILERRLRINFRNHRKILIIDGKSGFTGGVNVAQEHLHWRDMAFGFQGPVVHQMQEVFAEDWFFATGKDLAEQIYFPSVSAPPPSLPESLSTFSDVPVRFVASGPDDPLQTIHKMFFFAITNARTRIDIITPYFVPDTAIFTALQTAAMQGIPIRIILPGKTDVLLTRYAGRSFWESLLEIGIRLYEFDGPILHAKLLLLDQSHLLVGSANMDVRSFRLNFEANSVVESEEVNRAMTLVFEDMLRESTQIHLHEFQRRSRKERLLEGAARLFSPLL